MSVDAADGADPVQVSPPFLGTQIDRAADFWLVADVETIRAERDALIHELAVATGLAWRTPCLGDSVERARKSVSASNGDALSKITAVHP